MNGRPFNLDDLRCILSHTLHCNKLHCQMHRLSCLPLCSKARGASGDTPRLDGGEGEGGGYPSALYDCRHALSCDSVVTAGRAGKTNTTTPDRDPPLHHLRA